MTEPSLILAIKQELGLVGQFERVDLGQSNEVWFGPHWVVRAGSPRPGDQSLLIEAELVARLPPAIGYPQVLGAGVTDDCCWMVTERLPGTNLGVAWPELPTQDRERAVRDLRRRLDALPEVDHDRLPALAPTPLYALDADTACRQIEAARPTVGDGVAFELGRIVDAGLGALSDVPAVLVHSDVGFGNTVWDGERAIPVDFEFACIGPSDLDLVQLTREVVEAADPGLSGLVAELVSDLVDRPRGDQRLRCYAVLRDLWAYGKWLANAPDDAHKDTWAPTRQLVLAAQGKAWTDRVLRQVQAAKT